MNEFENRFFALTNVQRMRRRIRPLAEAPALSVAARRHSDDMLRRRFFAHKNPDRKNHSDRLRAVLKFSPKASAENIWMRSGAVPSASRVAEEAVAQLMASPRHRENIMNPRYTHLGVGVAVGASEVRVTQLFARFED